MRLDDAVSCLEYGDPLSESYDIAVATVVAALKAQEPRLVTIDDFKGADEYGWLPAWCEQQTDGAVYCECILADALKEKGIRYWTSRPTDEQREATPWQS
jgi:hypothetical protein